MCVYLKGPALLAYNDRQFETADFESIRNIEKSEKFNKPLKIGKFGLGFNSVYHLTVSEV
jgi:sacsin